MPGNNPADLNFRFRRFFVALQNVQHDISVINQQFVAGFQRFKNFLVRQQNPCFIARNILHVQRKLLPFFQQNFAVFERSDSELWSLHIRHNRYAHALFFRHTPYNLISPFVFFLCPVAEIKPEPVNPRLNQGADFFFGI